MKQFIRASLHSSISLMTRMLEFRSVQELESSVSGLHVGTRFALMDRRVKNSMSFIHVLLTSSCRKFNQITSSHDWFILHVESTSLHYHQWNAIQIWPSYSYEMCNYRIASVLLAWKRMLGTNSNHCCNHFHGILRHRFAQSEPRRSKLGRHCQQPRFSLRYSFHSEQHRVLKSCSVWKTAENRGLDISCTAT